MSSDALEWVQGARRWSSAAEEGALRSKSPPGLAVYEIPMADELDGFTEADIWQLFDAFVKARFSDGAPRALKRPVLRYATAVLDYLKSPAETAASHQALTRVCALHPAASEAIHVVLSRRPSRHGSQ